MHSASQTLSFVLFSGTGRWKLLAHQSVQSVCSGDWEDTHEDRHLTRPRFRRYPPKSPFRRGERSLRTHSLNDRPNLISLSDRASLREIGNKKKIWRKLIVWGVPASQHKADQFLLKTERFLYSRYTSIFAFWFQTPANFCSWVGSWRRCSTLEMK